MRLSTAQLVAEVQALVGEISSKFVVEPTIEEVKADLLLALKRYCFSVRCIAAKEEKSHDSSPPPSDPSDDADVGLETNLRPTNGWLPDEPIPVKNPAVEAYLLAVQRELLGHLNKMTTLDTRKPHSISKSIHSLLNHLKSRDDLVVVPTDKTNSYVVLPTSDYAIKVVEHLTADAKKTTTKHLNEIKAEADEVLEKYKDLFAPKEYNYAKSTLNNHRVPVVKLLVKDHKDPDEKGDFPTRLVVPAKNFTAAFPHLGQQGIKKILDRNKVNYQRKTIIQASHLKEQLEELPIRRSQHTVISIDAEKMYPSIKFNQIELAVNNFLRSPPKKIDRRPKNV